MPGPDAVYAAVVGALLFGALLELGPAFIVRAFREVTSERDE